MGILSRYIRPGVSLGSARRRRRAEKSCPTGLRSWWTDRLPHQGESLVNQPATTRETQNKLGAAAIPVASRGKWTATTPFCQAEWQGKNAHGSRRKIARTRGRASGGFCRRIGFVHPDV